MAGGVNQMSRRRFLRGVAASAAASTAATAAAAALAGAVQGAARGSDRAGRRPNILWLTCEDMSPILGCYGDAVARTPVLDRLASQGVRYTNAVGVAAVCVPNRSCLITGVHPTTLGSHPMRTRVTLPPGVGPFSALMRESGYWCTNNAKEDYQFATPADAWDATGRGAGEGKGHWRARPEAGRPFFAVFNANHSHESSLRDQSLYEQRTAELPPERRTDPASVRVPPYYPDTPATRRDLAKYYDAAAMVDLWAGRILAELEEDGLADDTIVFFFSDHGHGMTRAKRWPYEAGLRVPLIVRVPPRYRQAGQGEPGSVAEGLVSFVDFAPTVLHLAGLSVPGVMQGRAFLGQRLSPPRQAAYAARDRHDEQTDLVRVVRTGRYNYLRHYLADASPLPVMAFAEVIESRRDIRRLAEAGELKPPADWPNRPRVKEELFDLTTDPEELTNLAGDAAYGQTLASLRGMLRPWQEQTRDLGAVPEPMLRRRAAEHGSAYAAGLAAGQALPDYWQAAEEAWPGTVPLEVHRERLGHDDPVMRYWALYALQAAGPEARAALADISAAMQNDPDEAVRVAAARACLAAGHDPTAALRVLADLLTGPTAAEDELTRLYAAVALFDHVDASEVAREALLRVGEAEPSNYVRRMAAAARTTGR
ncbi:MAG: sulfatase [Phycisphaerae bacterium]